MSGPQHTFSPNFVAAGQNDLRSQFGGPQRGQLVGISSPGQPSIGIASPQAYNVGVSMQPTADSPIQTQQLQQPGTPQHLQLHLQQQLQQKVPQQSVKNSKKIQQQSAVGQSLPPQGIPSQPSPGCQSLGLQPLQQVVPPVGQNVIARLVTGESVSQNAVSTGVTMPTTSVSASAPQQPPTSHQYNTASLCTLGQETVQDIVTKLVEVLQILKSMPPPSVPPGIPSISKERKLKLTEYLKMLQTLFKRLRLIYERVNDSNQLPGTEYMHIESLIPLKEEWDVKTLEERKTSESYRLAYEERKELIELIITKNTALEEFIDRLRRIIWEINTMLSMTKS